MTMAIVAGAVITAGAGIYESSQASGTANKALGLAADTQGKQDYYNQQLMDMMANPGSVLNDPAFKATEAIGEQGVTRQMAAQGFKGSGNQAEALMNYGQGSATNFLQGQENMLAGLSGAGAASSPSQAINSATSAQGQQFQTINSLLASLGYGANTMMGGQQPGTTSGDQTPWNTLLPAGGGYTNNMPAVIQPPLG
jgi:hypothetical protein